MTHEGGRDKLDDPWREGLNNLDFGQSFLKFLKPDFFYVLGTFNFWVKGGANNFVPSIFLDRDQNSMLYKNEV